MKKSYLLSFLRAGVRQTVDRNTENNLPKSLIGNCPVSYIRCSSFCGVSQSFDCLSRSFAFAFAIATPSPVRSRIESLSDSAKVASTLKNIFSIGSAGGWLPAPASRLWPVVHPLFHVRQELTAPKGQARRQPACYRHTYRPAPGTARGAIGFIPSAPLIYLPVPCHRPCPDLWFFILDNRPTAGRRPLILLLNLSPITEIPGKSE